MGRVLTDEMRKSIRAGLTAAPAPSKNPARSRYRYNKGRPHRSEALGVHPDQVEEYRAELKRHGCTAEVRPDGRVEIGSEKQFQEVARIGGLFNGRDGYVAYDNDGNKIMTGREQGTGQQQLKRLFRNERRGYPKHFPQQLQRRSFGR